MVTGYLSAHCRYAPTHATFDATSAWPKRLEVGGGNTVSPDVVARLARVVIPGIPHHVTQRGSGHARTFFEDGEFALYLDLLAEVAQRARTKVWAIA